MCRDQVLDMDVKHQEKRCWKSGRGTSKARQLKFCAKWFSYIWQEDVASCCILDHLIGPKWIALCWRYLPLCGHWWQANTFDRYQLKTRNLWNYLYHKLSFDNQSGNLEQKRQHRSRDQSLSSTNLAKICSILLLFSLVYRILQLQNVAHKIFRTHRPMRQSSVAK